MHIKIQKYAGGGWSAFEVSDDGSDLLRDLEGQYQEGERVCALVDAACESNEQGYDRLLGAIEWLTAEVKKRKAAQARASA
jgi:hypothetical protein